MRYQLFDFQKKATDELLHKMGSMLNSYQHDGSHSAVSLTAPTGSGKTVICAAVIEGLFYGNDTVTADIKASVLWLSGSPDLNAQSMRRFASASDLLSPNSMETVTSQFAVNHPKLEPGHVYFMNRQLLTSNGILTKPSEQGRTFYDILRDTIRDKSIHLFLFIDEAHLGLGKNAISDSKNKTIYARLIDGQENLNPPMPIVVGISATPERFNKAMEGRKNRDVKAAVTVPVSEVRRSGLIKDAIELLTPTQAANTRHQDLGLACQRLAKTSKAWHDYCLENKIPQVVPLMVVQVEDDISADTLGRLRGQIRRTLPWLDQSDCFANVFGEDKDITTPDGPIPYCKPEDVEDHTEIHVLFAKEAISTGWDCPRAEVIYSRRHRSDPTYIAQLIGRMIRTPLARRISSMETLNTVACYLPNYDEQTVESVVDSLQHDNIPLDRGSILSNPVDVAWYGDQEQDIKRQLQQLDQQAANNGSIPTQPGQQTGISGDDFSVNLSAGEDIQLDAQQIKQKQDDLIDALNNRIPQADSDAVRKCFESIITRPIRHEKSNVFLDLWDCSDIVTSDIDPDSKLGDKLQEDFYNNIESQIQLHPAEFKRALNEITSTMVSIKYVDPLTGQEYRKERSSVLNDATRMYLSYREAIRIFGGASDVVKYYINRRMADPILDSQQEAICRISAAARCEEIEQGMEDWATDETHKLLDQYGPQDYMVGEPNKNRWGNIKDHRLSYVEQHLNIRAAITHQNHKLDRYPKHIITDENGWAYFDLNDLEHKVVTTELHRSSFVAWYRNRPNNLNASLAIPYKLDGQWKSMYPDFIFFEKARGGRIVPIIVDPHGDWIGDSIAKLQGYVHYLKDYPNMFGSVQAVTDEQNGKYRYLNLLNPKVQKAVSDFKGNTAMTLFTGPLAQDYILL